MKNDNDAAQADVPGERGEPLMPRHGVPVRYDRVPVARREPRLSASTMPSGSAFAAITGTGGQGTGYGAHLPHQPKPSSSVHPAHSAHAAHAALPITATTPATPRAAATSARADPHGQAGPDAPPIPELERMKGVGDTLNGRFVLEECIGFGGMGMVYKALDLRKLEASDRKPYIAIKVLNVQFRGHPTSLIALQREARKAQALAHPNIVAVYDFDRDGSMVYLTMEYLVGEPLSRSLRAADFTGMPLAQAMPVISGMARALAYAHHRGFVHCDLKPANVFLTERGDVKVIDFGIARVFQKTEDDQDATVFDAGSLGWPDAGLRQSGNARTPRAGPARRHLCACLHHL